MIPSLRWTTLKLISSPYNEERRDRRGEEKRGSLAIGSGDVALSNAGNRPGGEIAKPIENFRTLG